MFEFPVSRTTIAFREGMTARRSRYDARRDEHAKEPPSSEPKKSRRLGALGGSKNSPNLAVEGEGVGG
jgi:hypothetical protein